MQTAIGGNGGVSELFRRNRQDALMDSKVKGIVVVIICSLIGLCIGVPAGMIFERALVAPKKAMVDSKFSILSAALQVYHQQNGRFPPLRYRASADGPIHSWRVLLLPQLDRAIEYEKYDFSQEWDSAHNREVLATIESFLPYTTDGFGANTNFFGLDQADPWPKSNALKAIIVTCGDDKFQIVEVPGSSVKWASPEW